jgi:hypothetical protein
MFRATMSETRVTLRRWCRSGEEQAYQAPPGRTRRTRHWAPWSIARPPCRSIGQRRLVAECSLPPDRCPARSRPPARPARRDRGRTRWRLGPQGGSAWHPPALKREQATLPNDRRSSTPQPSESFSTISRPRPEVSMSVGCRTSGRRPRPVRCGPSPPPRADSAPAAPSSRERSRIRTSPT